MSSPEWLPAMVTLTDHNGKWDTFIDAIYSIFEQDFIKTECRFRKSRVGVRPQPSHDNKWFTFWHCVSEGRVEDHRTPDLRRCERIPWMRPIIEHDAEACVELWSSKKKGDKRLYLWYDEEYLVVLGKRSGYYVLITAFPTNRRHTIEKLRKKRDEESSP